MAESFVRDARVADAADLARIQVARWRAGYPGLVPDRVLAELTNEAAEERWREHWAQSLENPPSSRHRVLAAITVEPAGSQEPGGAHGAAGAHGAGGVQARSVAGFAALGPSTDPDKWPGTEAELYELCVEPGRRGQGHGSRLLNAAAATLADDGFGTVCGWILAGDATARAFLEASGWAPDGTRGELEMGVGVPVIRLHASLSPAGG